MISSSWDGLGCRDGQNRARVEFAITGLSWAAATAGGEFHVAGLGYAIAIVRLIVIVGWPGLSFRLLGWAIVIVTVIVIVHWAGLSRPPRSSFTLLGLVGLGYRYPYCYRYRGPGWAATSARVEFSRCWAGLGWATVIVTVFVCWAGLGWCTAMGGGEFHTAGLGHSYRDELRGQK